MNGIGFIGLGVMGLPMATNLLQKSKKRIIGFDVFENRRRIFEDNGGLSVADSNEIYKSCDLIFLCLPTNELVESSVKDIIATGRKNIIIVDLSSTSPSVIRNLYSLALFNEIGLIDSPVSGGEAGAIAGTLVLMCGGNKKIFDVVQPLLLTMGTTATYMGDTGCGCVAKLANNMIVGCNIGAVSEAFAFAVKYGLDPETLYLAIKDGFAGSAVLNSKAPKIISQDFSPSARVAVHQKDLKNAVQLAESMNVQIPLTNQVLDYMNILEAQGRVNEDHCAIARVYEDAMGVKIAKINDIIE